MSTTEETLIAKLAMVMPGYMDVWEEDDRTPFIMVYCGQTGESILPLTAEENALLQKIMQEVKIGDDQIIHRKS